jgi:tetraacyldisaccharide 4'-kinase
VRTESRVLPRDGGAANEYAMKFQIGNAFQLNNPREKKSLNDFKNHSIHAFAGIGNPKRFFEMLKDNGLKLTEHPFPDHYQFQAKDFLNLDSTDLILMTEKDSVKCAFLNDPRIWVLPIKAELTPEFFSALLKKLEASPPR